MLVEGLLAHNHADWFGFFFSHCGIGGGALGRGNLLRLLGECLSPHVRKGSYEEELGRGVGQALVAC